MFATDPLSLLFLGCALFSGLFLVLTVVLGVGHGHAGHLGGHVGGHLGGHVSGHVAGQTAATHAVGHAHVPAQTTGRGSSVAQTPAGGGLWSGLHALLLGSLNLNGALMFLLVFGVLGYMLNVGHAGTTLLILFIAALIGALAAIVVNAALTRIFITSQAGELTDDNSRREGQLATVSIAIRAQGIGEVIYTGEAGARHSVGARSADGSAVPAGAQVVIIEEAHGLATVQSWESFLSDTRERLISPKPASAASLSEPVAEPTAPPGSEATPSA
jgi:membrane protein implicated in regulation of membrane protease activity